MALFDPPRILAAANADPEFRLTSRFWDARVQLAAGAEVVTATIQDGKMTACAPGAADSPPDLRISAAPDEWARLLEPMPRPFYQDLLAASFRHGFTVEGELEAYAPYYPAVARFIQLLRDLGSEGR